MLKAFVHFGLVAIALLSGMSAAGSQPPPGATAIPPQSTGLAMLPLPPQGGGVGPVIIGGTPANAADWPATLIFETPSGFCTSTAIGSRIILTAAHCIDDRASGTITVAGAAIQITCRHHPSYAPDSAPNHTADVAICTAATDVPVPLYERVNTRAARVIVQDRLTLLGYGCRQPGGGGPSQALYEGPAEVTTVPNPGQQDHYAVTKGGAAVCFGDSGGGAYKADGTLRFLVGVNSRGDISTRSWLTWTSQPEVLAFIRDEAGKAHAKVCGMDSDATRCR